MPSTHTTEIRDGLEYRYEPAPTDRDVVRHIVESTGFFYPHEIDVAVELVDECVLKGPASGYHFVFVGLPGQPAQGYACYGPIACTAASYDLYWIAVESAARGKGLGRLLLAESERRIAASGGHRIYVETSSRDHYLPTRTFYERCRYRVEAVLPEFYGPNDDKVIYVKVIC